MNKLPEILEKEEHVVLGDAIYFPDMEHNFYHQVPGVSSSNIRRFGQSQLHAFEEDNDTTPAMKFGTASHSLIVEGEEAFVNDVVCLTGSPYTNANKELKKEYEDRGLTVITSKDKQTIYGMKEALIPEGVKHLSASKGEYPEVFNSPFERAIFWWEKDLLLKVKSDVLRYPLDASSDPKSIILVDYKTTVDCSVRGFTSSIRKYQYDLQAAWYKRGYERAGFNVVDFLFVAQEKKKPFASKVFKMNHDDMTAGWLKLEHLLGEYNAVLDGKEATIYNSPSIVNVDLKGWGE
jgi:hypothetical protein|tara:strand:+ start:1257 stop:2132 length:876 start_codon:yes stop_codon:yes gene_type:complete